MQNRKVAIIDDDTKFLGEIEEILTISGYVPVVVSDWLLVEDIIAHSKPDVVLLELRMPSKNRFKVTNEINQVFQTRRMPIIAMSAFFKDELSWLLDFSGIRKLLKKPFQPLDVIWAIENEIGEGNPWEGKSLSSHRNYDITGAAA
jgi:DNA-binding response OmpR family regulator